jgi:hypothetical protein
MNRCIKCRIEIPLRRTRGGTWLRYCFKCRQQKATEGAKNVPHQKRSEAAKRAAAAMTPEQRSEKSRNLKKAMATRWSSATAEERSKYGKRASVALYSRLTPEERWQRAHKAQVASTEARRTKFAATVSTGFSLCPHCECNLPLDYFPKGPRRLGGLDLSRCMACRQIESYYRAFPVVMKRTGKLHIPCPNFQGFNRGRVQFIYEHYWLSKLESTTDGEQL